jgi:hypothetical protein
MKSVLILSRDQRSNEDDLTLQHRAASSWEGK